MKRFVFVVMTILLAGCMPNYSDGSRTGTITKFSHKGIIWKTWEGQINQGGMKSVQTDTGTQMVPNVLDFNVPDRQDLVEAVQKAQESGQSVCLAYTQWLVAPPSIGSRYVLTDIKPLGEEKK